MQRSRKTGLGLETTERSSKSRASRLAGKVQFGEMSEGVDKYDAMGFRKIGFRGEGAPRVEKGFQSA